MNGRSIAIGVAALGSGLVGGVLFAFSSFVMPALRRIPAPQGISAMQSINRQATTFAFMTLIGGTLAVAVGVGVQAVLRQEQAGAGWVEIGTVAYLAALGITGAVNVPRNDHLAGFDASTPEAARYWSTFLSDWIVANHIRTAFCIIAAASFTIALRRP